jgi:hypothetical protein
MIRPKLAKYLPPPLDVACVVHELDGKLVALVYLGAHRDGFAAFLKDGFYPDGKPAFRAGEIFYRNGSSSQRLDQQGLKAIIERRVEQRLEAAREEFTRQLADALARQSNLQAGTTLANAPAETLDFTMPSSILRPAAIQLLRANDTIPLRLLLNGTLGQARQAIASEDWNTSVAQVLDGLTAFAACLHRGRCSGGVHANAGCLPLDL